MQPIKKRTLAVAQFIALAAAVILTISLFGWKIGLILGLLGWALMPQTRVR